MPEQPIQLSPQQQALLARLPTPASNGSVYESGLFCKGPHLITARSLVEKGLARQVAPGMWAGGYFVKVTDAT